jgi:glutamate dehydrogenase (NADP+)
MTQNSMKLRWNRKEVDDRLHEIMCNIHEQCVKYGRRDDGYVDYVRGANIAGFLKVANSMLDMGVI